MTTLDNGIVIDESITATHLTPAADVPAVFGMARDVNGATKHHWGDDGQDIHTVARYLASDNARQSSAHFVLQEDYVYCIVSPDDAAWHAAHPEGNARTIGIECRPEMTPGDLLTLESLLRYLETIYGDLIIYNHSDWTNTACPGRYTDKTDEIVAAVNGGSPVTPPPINIPADAPEHHCCCHD